MGRELTGRNIYTCKRCGWVWPNRGNRKPFQCPRCQRREVLEVSKDAIRQAIAGEKIGTIDAELSKAMTEAQK